MNEHPLQGSGPVNPCNPANPLFANGTIDKFEATESAGCTTLYICTVGMFELRGSGPVYLCDSGNPLFANRTIDRFEATANAGHQVATGKEHGVHQIVHTHLAFRFCVL